MLRTAFCSVGTCLCSVRERQEAGDGYGAPGVIKMSIL